MATYGAPGGGGSSAMAGAAPTRAVTPRAVTASMVVSRRRRLMIPPESSDSPQNRFARHPCRTEADDRPARPACARASRRVVEFGPRPYVEEDDEGMPMPAHDEDVTVTPQRRGGPLRDPRRRRARRASPMFRIDPRGRLDLPAHRGRSRVPRPRASPSSSWRGAMTDVAPAARPSSRTARSSPATSARTRCPVSTSSGPRTRIPSEATAMTRLDTDDAVATEASAECDGPRALLLESREVPLGGVRGDGGAPQRSRSATCRWSARGASSTASDRR